MITFKHVGDFSSTTKFLKNPLRSDIRNILESYGRLGVNALSAATPKDSGLTGGSWSYEIAKTNTGFGIFFINSNFNDGIPIVILIQYGHGTKNGAFVRGQDFINPALKPVFSSLCDAISKEVSKT